MFGSSPYENNPLCFRGYGGHRYRRGRDPGLSCGCDVDQASRPVRQAGQAQQQAILDASQVAAREEQYSPFTQLGLVGQQLAQIQPGAFPTQTVGYQQPQAPASPLAQALGIGTGIASIGSKLGLFGS